MSFYARTQYPLKSPEQNFMERLIYLEHLGEDRPGPQLDVGCSVGNFVNLDPARLQGFDIDREALEICRQRGLNCSYFDLVGENFSQADHFEVIYLRHVIEHMEDPLATMLKLKGALKPGGLLIVETPDYPMASKRKVKNFWDDYTHKRPFTFTALHRLSTDAGFDVVRSMRKPHYGYWTKKMLKRGIIKYTTAFTVYSTLNIVLGDLLFVLKKP